MAEWQTVLKSNSVDSNVRGAVTRASWRQLREPPWVILGVEPTASPDRIRFAHKQLVFDYEDRGRATYAFRATIS